jgi:hypothetical protein
MSYLQIHKKLGLGQGCQQTDDGEQKTEDSKGASSSSFHHLSSVVWSLTSET